MSSTASFLFQLSPSSGRASGSESKRDSSSDSFQTFMNTFLEAARAVSKSANREMSPKQDANDLRGRIEWSARAGGMQSPLPPKEREALERIAVLTADGGLSREVVESLDEEDLGELQDWVLAGAAGLFPPLEQIPEGEGSLHMGLEFGLAEAGEALQQMEQLLQRLGAALNGDAAGEHSLLGQLAGLEGMTELEIDALAQAMLQAAGVDDAEGLPLGTVMQEADPQALLAALEDALAQQSGEAVDLPEMPAAVVKSLAIEILQVNTRNLDAASQSLPLPDGVFSNEALREEIMARIITADAQELSGSMESRSLEALREEMTSQLSEGGESEVPVPAGGDGLAKTRGLAEALLDDLAETEGADLPMDVSGEDGAALEEWGEALSGATLDSAMSGAMAGTDEGGEVAAGAQPVGGVQSAQAPAAVPESSRAYAQYMAQNIEQIEQMLRYSVRQGMNNLTLQLSPPELGRMTLTVEVKNGQVEAIIRTETAEARDMLMMGVEHLRRTMQVQGMELEGFDVAVDQEAFAGQDQWQNPSGNQQDGGESRSQRHQSGAAMDRGAEDRTHHEEAQGGVFGDGSVNIVA